MTSTSLRLLAPLWSVSLGLAASGWLVEWFWVRGDGLASVLVPFFSLSYEHNLPTWFSASLLMCCALALGAQAAIAPAWRAHWWGLSAGFAFMSLDEAVGLHEHLGVLPLDGVLYFSWVVPAAIVVTVVGVVYLRFLRALPEGLRRGVMLAAALYVGGAVGMELPLGWWAERHGNDNLTYAAIDHVEELLEMLGASLFLALLVEELRKRVTVVEAAHA